MKKSPFKKKIKMPLKQKKPIARIGKRGQINLDANVILKKLYKDKGITRCEVCNSDFALSWHHKYPRDYYYKSPLLLSAYEQTVLLCATCHDAVHKDLQLSQKTFEKLRASF